MTHWWRDLDRILRGEATRSRALSRGAVDVQPGGLTVLLVILSMAYGACMGSFALFKEGGPSLMQLVASTPRLNPTSTEADFLPNRPPLPSFTPSADALCTSI